MKLPFSMVPPNAGGAVVAGIIVVALLAFAFSQAVKTPPANNQQQR